MKKNIYNLKRDEITKLKKELVKTAYYRIFLLQYFAAVIITLFFGTISMHCFSLGCTFTDTDMILPFYITVSLIILFTAKFMFKRVELLKDYYETKNEKKD